MGYKRRFLFGTLDEGTSIEASFRLPDRVDVFFRQTNVLEVEWASPFNCQSQSSRLIIGQGHPGKMVRNRRVFPCLVNEGIQLKDRHGCLVVGFF